MALNVERLRFYCFSKRYFFFPLRYTREPAGRMGGHVNNSVFYFRLWVVFT